MRTRPPFPTFALLLAGTAALPAGAMQMTIFDAGGKHQRVALETEPAPSATPSATPAPNAPRMTVMAQGGGQAHRSVALPAAGPAGEAPLAVFTVAAPAPAAAAEPPRGVESRLYAEARQESLDWRIGVPGQSPDVISELSWRGLRSAGLRWEGAVPLGTHWAVEGGLAYAESLSGEVRDSDYESDGRRDPWSVSESDARKSRLYDLHLGGRYRIGLAVPRGTALTLHGGLALHDRRLRIGRTEMIVSRPPATLPAGTTFDADSQYRVRWYGPYAGLGVQFALGPDLDLAVGYRHSWTKLKGRGHWALRSDFAQPDSFIHEANARLHEIDLSLAYRLDGGGQLLLGAHHLRSDSDRGRDDTRWAQDGGIGLGSAIDLKELRWRSTALRLGYSLDF
ncbi:outer membrane beta-barrel protein [Pseudothauera rhizosphaerae]|uniref:Protochlamydia outer membrane protein domain-containing protein n=1 Tax=Pseudothauera rhizosphaerae TaxID=2565932 RepID=A0A4S4ATY5_9RHOO|nr:outer membrane beta-barrel protein [Pseudothauera rhizosphaerae]THF62679.1 hypothetical protein E6O51_06895 [Pseudothauera rhizosphaerae]